MEYKITFGYSYVCPPPGEPDVPMPMELENAGLTVDEYRVYFHLSKRAAKHGTWLGIAAMRRTCKLRKHIAIQSVRALEKRCMLRIIEQPGKPPEYVLTAPPEWKKL